MMGTTTMMRRPPSGLLIAMVLLAGCRGAGTGEDVSAPAPSGSAQVTASPSPSASPSALATPAPSPSPSSSTAVTALEDAELAELGVNEVGRIPVIMWHDIGDEDTRYGNSMSTFLAQLQELSDRGYRPISAAELATGRIDLPAGLSPVLLTFDDSYKEHMYFAEDGVTPHPDSVVGILQRMEREDPTWRARAVFSFFWPVPFRETDQDLITAKLRYLVEHGFDLANHTYHHDNLREMTDAEVEQNLAAAEAELAARVGDDYRVRVMTLTQGIWPENRELAMRGSANGFTYEHDFALEVGFMPTRSPHHVEFDPMNVMRVQSYVPEFDLWIDWLDAEPGRRYISDGDPETVAYPEGFAEVAAPRDGMRARPYPEGDAETDAP